MDKKTDQELTRGLEQIYDGVRRTVDNQLGISNVIDRIIGLIEFLMKSVSVIFFILTLLVWRVFLWAPFSDFLDKTGTKWTSLSEGYQILVLGFVGTVIAGIIAHIAGSLLLARITNILKRE